MQVDDVKVGGVMDGGDPLLLPACMFLHILERARTLPARSRVEGDVLMDEEHPLPLQQWKRLKHPGLQGLAMSQSAILVTYGPAMVSTPGLLLWVWAWRGW